MNGNYSTSPEEESATGRPDRDRQTGHLLPRRGATDAGSVAVPPLRGTRHMLKSNVLQPDTLRQMTARSDDVSADAVGLGLCLCSFTVPTHG